MISLAVIMNRIFAQRAAKHRRANRYGFRDALTFYGFDEPLCVGIIPSQQLHRVRSLKHP
jgi:hypothetical protein